MKITHLLAVAASLLTMATGCISEPDFAPVAGGCIEISLDGSINQIPTKVTADGFETGDALGLYAVNYENENQTPGTLISEGNQADHVKYIFSFENWQWTPVRKVYYKDINTNVDLYVFYPHAEPASVEAYNFEVQKDQTKPKSQTALGGYEASDFLWAKVENVAPTEGKIKVQLDHKMAGVQVILTEGTGFEQDEFPLLEKNVLAVNTTRKATINMATGEVTPLGEPQANGIVMCPQTDGSFRGIVVPQSVDAGTHLFKITIDGMTYNFKKDTDFTYEAGKISKFTIKINRKSHTGEYELELVEADIVAWTEDINEHDGEARQYYCVNVTEPGTLGRLIKADNKNPMKIRNLKVSGTISDEDFYFMRDSMAILEAVNLKESRVVDVYCDGDMTNINGTYIHRDPLPGHKNEYGNPTVFVERKVGMYNDVIPDAAFFNKKTLYYVAFPEKIAGIGYYAFANSSISGTLVIPDDVTHIWSYAFYYTNISNLVLSPNVEIIGSNVFNGCSSLSGTLSLSETMKYIGGSAFHGCFFTGNLILPNSLEYIGDNAFYSAGNFVGGLVIPEKINILYEGTFSAYTRDAFNGSLNLSNVQVIHKHCFVLCSFTGELSIPEGTTEINSDIYGTFSQCKYTSVTIPGTVKKIEENTFQRNSRLMNVSFPEGLISIGSGSFQDCSQLQSLELPSTLQTIQSNAFKGCTSIGKIICHSVEPPTVQAGAFDGVPKDNFTLEVPANAINRYATDPVWGQFKRISAHYDFSISRRLARALNAETSKTYVLRAPANYDWIVENKPDWITVTPSSGAG